MRRFPRFITQTLLGFALLMSASPGFTRPPGASENTPSATSDSDELAKKLDALREEIAILRRDQAASARLEEIERQIAALSREIERLRSGTEADPVASTTQAGLGAAASKVYSVRQGVSVGGYGEMLFQAPGSQRQDGSDSGRPSQLDFVRAVMYFGYKFDDRLLFNSEIEVEHANTDRDGEVAAEFAYLEFRVRPELNVRTGLLLLPMGFINELHEPPAWLGARRPLTERQILPSTWRENGVGVTGDSGQLTWRAYLVNGMDSSGFAAEGIREGRQSGGRALAEDFALTGRLDFEPTLALLLGGSFYVGNSGQDADFDARTTLFDFHAQYRNRGFDVRALYAHGSISDAAEINAANGLEGGESVGSRLAGGYFQLGYDVLARRASSRHSLTPYVRWERVNTQASVPAGFVANPANDKRIITMGAAWKPHPQVSIKADFENWSDEASRGVDQFNIQLGYLF